MRGGGGARPDWPAYLRGFHAERPGITEDTLGRSRHRRGEGDGIDPYGWLAEALPTGGTVLDLACGSAPLLARRGTDRWLGLDRSVAELSRARASGHGRLVCADAARLPVPSTSVDGVLCAMAIMALQPLGTVTAEIHRVLRPGGTAVFLLPGRRPLGARDLVRYGRLMVALRQTHLAYPNDHDPVGLDGRLREAGLIVTDDRRCRFVLALGGDGSRLFVRSLYLPGVAEARVRAAAEVAGRWAADGIGIGIPLRRVTARRD